MSDVQDLEASKSFKKSSCNTTHFMMLLPYCNSLRSHSQKEHACFLKGTCAQPI